MLEQTYSGVKACKEKMAQSQSKIFILSGPSGAGKTTIHERLLRSADLKKRVVRSVSMTTRERRPEERNGRDYIFISHRMFEYKIRAGHFLEWAKVFDHYYGTPARQVNGLLSSGKSVLLCIDVQGARQVMRKRPDAVSIFIKAPSMKELRSRLSARGTEAPAALDLRIRTAQKEVEQAVRYDHVVINDDLDRACSQTRRIIFDHIQPG